MCRRSFADVKFNIKIFNDNELKNKMQLIFDPGAETKIIIHGFQSSCENDIFIKIKKAYLASSDHNVFCLNWSTFASGSYMEAIKNTWIVGRYLSFFLDWLSFNTGLDLKEVHLIGHSLGAHVAGIIGKNVQLGVIGQITGLDPATFFIALSPKRTLYITDALLVEIVFTSILAIDHPLGHINYFLNGGINQPECKTQSPQLETSIKNLDEMICNHLRAYEVFAEVILKPKLYPAKICMNSSLALSGETCIQDEGDPYFMFDVDYLVHGIFYVGTMNNLVDKRDIK